MKQELIAWMNGERVGVFTRHNNGAHTFHYASSWLHNRLARPLSLSLPLQLPAITSAAVINYFDNLLPDSPLVRDRIVARYHAQSRQPFDLLSEVGKDSVGALMLLPPGHSPADGNLNYTLLSEERLAHVLAAYQVDIPLGMINGEDDFRISVAGAQEKTALLAVDAGWAIPHGATPTSHIIKLPIGVIKQPYNTLDMRDSVENEFLCLALAQALGFAVPQASMISAGNMRALAVQRFDRRWNRDRSHLLRLPQEDMCQVFGYPSALKYESDGGPGIAPIMDFLMGSSNALADRDNFMKFQVFQWLIGATDGHAKNFSVFLERGGSYRLTPFYDIMSVFPVMGGTGLNIRDVKLAMSLKASKGKKSEIDKIFPRHFIATAKQVNFAPSRMIEILDFFVDEMEAAIERVAKTLPDTFPAAIADALFTHTLRMLERLKK